MAGCWLVLGLVFGGLLAMLLHGGFACGWLVVAWLLFICCSLCLIAFWFSFCLFGLRCGLCG